MVADSATILPGFRQRWSGLPDVWSMVVAGDSQMIIVIILVLLLFGGGGGFYGNQAWGPVGGAGVGLGTILVILLVCYLLGFFR